MLVCILNEPSNRPSNDIPTSFPLSSLHGCAFHATCNRPLLEPQVIELAADAFLKVKPNQYDYMQILTNLAAWIHAISGPKWHLVDKEAPSHIPPHQ
jgi:hypothetical protein